MLEFVKYAVDGPALSFAAKSLNTKQINAAVREAQPMRAIAPAQLDVNPWL
jgi:hypothetical protein